MARKEGEEAKMAAEPTGGRAEVQAASCYLPSGPCPSSPPGGVEAVFGAEAAAKRRGCMEQRKSNCRHKARSKGSLSGGLGLQHGSLSPSVGLCTMIIHSLPAGSQPLGEGDSRDASTGYI